MAVTAVSPGTDRAPLRSDLLSCDTRILESLLGGQNSSCPWIRRARVAAVAEGAEVFCRLIQAALRPFQCPASEGCLWQRGGIGTLPYV